MPATHDYNPSNDARTCLWCGNKLRRNSIWTAVRRDTPTGFVTEPVATPTDTYGWEGNGYFCTLRCGEAFGIAFANLGKRLQPKT